MARRSLGEGGACWFESLAVASRPLQRRPRQNELFFSVGWHTRIIEMRASSVILAFAAMAGVLFAADVRDLGVPTGWSASQYEKHGYDLLNKRDYQNARRYFDAAIRTDPNMWTAYYNRAMMFCQQKKWAAALQDLNSTIRLKRNFFTAALARAGVNNQLGNYKASLIELDNLLRSHGQGP